MSDTARGAGPEAAARPAASGSRSLPLAPRGGRAALDEGERDEDGGTEASGELRTSSYVIYVPLPDTDEQMLVVHGHTGAYDRVSRNVARFLMSREAGDPPDPLHGTWISEPALRPVSEPVATPAPEVVESLTRRGYLTTMSVPEEEGHVARFAKKLHDVERRSGPGYLFMPTYDCNLRCSYCFQDHMRTDPEFSHLLRTMTPEMVDRIFEAMVPIERDHGIEETDDYSRDIGLYGGEPLLAANRSIVEYIVESARARGPATFWAVSNATELDAYEDLLGPDGVASLQITLDGPPEEHDQRRVYADGSGSFAKIARNIDMCLDLGVNVSIRMNLDRVNLRHVPRLADEIVARGWDRRDGFSVYTARIVPANENVERDTVFATTWELDEAIDELRAVHPSMSVIGRPDDGLELRARAIFESRAAGRTQFKSSYCAAHSTMYIFDPFGDIYACWERTGDPKIRIGHLEEDGSVQMNEALTRRWRSRTPASNPTCRKCRYAFHCGGGCAVLAEGQKGKFFTNYCDGFGERFRHSVAQAYLDHVAGVEAQEQMRVCDL